MIVAVKSGSETYRQILDSLQTGAALLASGGISEGPYHRSSEGPRHRRKWC